MKLVLRPNDDPYQQKKAHPITDEEIEKGLKDGTLKQIKGNVYMEIEAETSEYDTKVMTAKKKVAKPRAKKKPATKKRRAVKKATA